MAKKRPRKSGTSHRYTSRKQRNELIQAGVEIAEARKALTEGIVGSHQEPEEGLFSTDMLSKYKLVKPSFDPVKMARLVESSGILPQCVDAFEQNVDGFGYDFLYQGSADDENSDSVLAEKAGLFAFFNQINEKESFTTIRKAMRRDMEGTGNGYLEVIRFMDNSIAAMYSMDARYIRLQALQAESVEVTVKLYRGGKEVEVPLKKRFRRYAMVTSTARKKIKWFKEFGDPRKMDSITGKYENELGGNAIKEEASEVIHFKLGNDTYGAPRWSGQVLNVLGMNSADYVNWDLFENQVVPPMAIMVSGGTLTQESVKDVKAILLQKKGVENFNKVLVLEAQPEGNISDKSGTKIELKELSQARKEDAMFIQYSEKGEHRVRGSFRLPPMYVGRADSYSKSTADSSRMIAEEQVFVPERSAFDEVINVLIMPELGEKNWKFVSQGPKLITGAEIIEGFKEFSRAGILTINEGIRLANRILGMDIVKYEQKWADYPIPIVIEMARLGYLKDIEEISVVTGNVVELIQKARDKGGPEGAADAYRLLSGIRDTLMDMAEKKREDELEVEEDRLKKLDQSDITVEEVEV